MTNKSIRWWILPTLALGLGLPGPPSRGDAAAPWQVLIFSKTAGFRHASIPDGIQMLQELGAAHGFDTTATEDAAVFTAAGLAPYAVVVWLNTTGDVLDDTQQAAFRAWVETGGGFVGIHSAADTEHGWDGYGELLGGDAWFSNHPPIQTADLTVEDPTHPSTHHLPAGFSFTDEWYNFQVNPRPSVSVLLTLDESSYNPGAGAMGSDHPVAWAHRVGEGRCWYTNLGHRSETYADPGFREHVAGGVLWAAGRLVFREGFEVGDTRPWARVFP